MLQRQSGNKGTPKFAWHCSGFFNSRHEPASQQLMDSPSRQLLVQQGARQHLAWTFFLTTGWSWKTAPSRFYVCRRMHGTVHHALNAHRVAATASAAPGQQHRSSRN